MHYRTLAFALIAASTPFVRASAQTGPFIDGELIVRASDPITGGQVVLRVNPQTGHGVQFISNHYYGGGAGGMAFDSYRDALLICTSLPPDPYWMSSLWTVASDGSASAVPSLHGVSVRGLAAVGDGRVFFQRNISGTQQPIEYLDAGNQPHVLMDATGSVPFVFDVEHLLYHAPSNSLIATTSNWWSLNDCSPSGDSIFRVPLSADGTRVGGPVQCASVVSSLEDLMGLDLLPGGDLLLTVASGAAYPPTGLMRRVDPWTLSEGVYAETPFRDLNGGVFSHLLNKVLVLDDATDVLRGFDEGESGSGTVITTDISLSNGGSGYSPVESLCQVELQAPAGCTPPTVYCSAKTSSAGCVPSIGFSGQPTASGASAFSVTCTQVLNQKSGRLFYGHDSQSFAFQGGTFCIKSPVVRTLLQNSGGNASPVSDCSGSYSFDFEAQILGGFDPSLVAGEDVFAQYWYRDPQDPAGFGTGLSNALHLQICP